MIQKLTGKVAVATGASNGIAAAIPVSQKSGLRHLAGDHESCFPNPEAAAKFRRAGRLPQGHQGSSASLPALVNAPHLKMDSGSAFLLASTFSQEKGRTPLQE
jgi:hypothetical protein